MSDNAYFENLIANAKDGETVIVEPKSSGDPYLITGEITVWRPITIDFNGQTMVFEYVTGEKTPIPGEPIDQQGKRKGFFVRKGGPSYPPTPHTDEFSRVVFRDACSITSFKIQALIRRTIFTAERGRRFRSGRTSISSPD